MCIKEKPISKNKKFAGFELDASKIGLHSTHKREIRLPYSGLLPDGLQHNADAVISVNLTAGLRICIDLIVTMDGKKLRYPVEATAQEINDILFPFFFEDVGSNKYHTRFGNGLDDYWLGNYQSSYTHWKRFVYEGHGIDDVINQLSPVALDRVIRYIDECKRTA